MSALTPNNSKFVPAYLCPNRKKIFEKGPGDLLKKYLLETGFHHIFISSKINTRKKYTQKSKIGKA